MWLLFKASFYKYLCLIISGPVGWDQCVIYCFLCITLFVSTSELYTRGRKTHSTCQWCCPSGERRRTNQLWLKSWHVAGINWTPPAQQVRTQSPLSFSLVSSLKKKNVCMYLHDLYYYMKSCINFLHFVHFILGANQKPNQYSSRGAGTFKKGLTIPLTAAEVMLFNLMKGILNITFI